MNKGLTITVFCLLALIGCGNGDFSSPGPHSDAGSGATMAGNGSMAGAGGHAGHATGGTGGDVSDAGDANDPAVWSGKTYFLSVPASSWTAPPHIGGVLGGIAPALLLTVDGSGDSLTTTISTSAGNTTSDDASQDMCTPTSYTALDASNYPKSEIGPLDVRAHLVSGSDAGATQVTATLYGLHLTNVLPGDDQISGSIETTVDMRELYVLFPALGSTRTPESVCNSFAANYSPADCSTADCMHKCEPCPADGKPYCLTLKADSVSAQATTASVVELAGSDRSRSCADSKP